VDLVLDVIKYGVPKIHWTSSTHLCWMQMIDTQCHALTLKCAVDVVLQVNELFHTETKSHIVLCTPSLRNKAQ
jgi:hypothetical protein